mgnify:CR=1 FL=1
MDTIQVPQQQTTTQVVAEAKPAVSAEVLKKILESIQLKMPNTKFKAISATPVKGLYALTSKGGRTFYTDESGRYFITGIIFDTYTGATVENQIEGISNNTLNNENLDD